jgi:hypothetical protein
MLKNILFSTFLVLACIANLEAYSKNVIAPKKVCSQEDQTSLSLTFLYYQGINHGYIFAEDGYFKPFPEPDEQYLHFKEKEVSHNYHPGLKATINHAWKDFRLFFDYQYLHISDHKKCQSNFESSVLGLRPIFVFQGFGSYEFAKAFYRLNYNAFDWYMDFPISPNKYFSFYPLLGLKGTSLYQRFYNKFWNIPEKDPNQFIPWIVDYKTHNNYWGIGLLLGSDGTWFMNHEFHLNAGISTALLYGKRMVKSRAHSTFAPFFEHKPKSLLWYEVMHDQYARNQFVPALFSHVGLEYDHTFENCIRLTTSVFWEFDYFWSQYFSSLLDETQLENSDKGLEMQGLNLQMQISF